VFGSPSISNVLCLFGSFIIETAVLSLCYLCGFKSLCSTILSVVYQYHQWQG